MSVTICLPSYLQPYADGQSEVELRDSCATVAEALGALGRRYPGVRDRVFTERGEVRQHVNIFLDEQHVRERQGLATPIPDGGELVILPAVSGG